STTLKELFTDIEAQIDYKFAYTDDLDIKAKHFNEVVRLKEVNLNELIDQLNNHLPMRFSVIGDNITVHETLRTSQEYFVYSGKITDEFGQPLIGVSIHVKEAGTGTTTD